jgi:hypothetical protein
MQERSVEDVVYMLVGRPFLVVAASTLAQTRATDRTVRNINLTEARDIADAAAVTLPSASWSRPPHPAPRPHQRVGKHALAVSAGN